MTEYLEPNQPDWAEQVEIVEIEPPLPEGVVPAESDAEQSGVSNSQADSRKAGYGTPLQGRSGRRGEGPIKGRNPIKKEPEPLKDFAKKNLEDQGEAAGGQLATLITALSNALPLITTTEENPPPSLGEDAPKGRDWGRSWEEGEGGDFSHPWKVTISGDDTVNVVAGSLFFEDLSTDVKTTVTGYSEEDGTDFGTFADGNYVYIEMTLSADMEITSPELKCGAIPSPLDGNFFNLKGDVPDYAETQYLPIAKIEGSSGDWTVIQFVYSHIKLGIVAVDGALIYHHIGG